MAASQSSTTAESKAEDDRDSPSLLKLRADLQYFEARYSGALDDYVAALELVPANNPSLRRDISQSLARCYLIVGKHEEAVSVAYELLDGCINDDQVLCCYNLLLDILSTSLATDAASAASYRHALQNCLLLNPLCNRLWLDLAKLYEQLGHSERSAACQLTARHIETVTAIQESDREKRKKPSTERQTGESARPCTPAVVVKSLALVSFHANYKNLPYASRLSQSLNIQEAEASFNRKRLHGDGNEALFDSIYFSGHNGALLTQLSDTAGSSQSA